MKRVAVLAVILGLMTPVRAQRAVLSTRPDTPFKLATFEAAGKVCVGLVLGSRVLDIESAHAMIVQEIALRGAPAMSRDMRTLIEHDEEVAGLAATSTGKASWRSSSGSRRSGSPKRRRTITCSATASCTT